MPLSSCHPTAGNHHWLSSRAAEACFWLPRILDFKVFLWNNQGGLDMPLILTSTCCSACAMIGNVPRFAGLNDMISFHFMMYIKSSSDDTAKHSKQTHKQGNNNTKPMLQKMHIKRKNKSPREALEWRWNAKKNKGKTTHNCPLKTMQKKGKQQAKQKRTKPFWSLLLFFASYLPFDCLSFWVVFFIPWEHAK